MRNFASENIKTKAKCHITTKKINKRSAVAVNHMYKTTTRRKNATVDVIRMMNIATAIINTDIVMGANMSMNTIMNINVDVNMNTNTSMEDAVADVDAIITMRTQGRR